MSADIIAVPTSSSSTTEPMREELRAGAVRGGDLHLAIMKSEESLLEIKKIYMFNHLSALLL